MTQRELKSRYTDLYLRMKHSKKISNMKIFGKVMDDIMDLLIIEHPDLAEQCLTKLCAVEWNNYLTHTEAEKILASMTPPAHWTYDNFVEAVKAIGGEIEHSPSYNSYALWVAMNMVYSDSGHTLASLMGRSLKDVPGTQITQAVYLLAVDKLTDADGVFEIRRYFHV